MPPFFGRVAELRTLAEIVGTSAGPAAALVTGVPGAGKSRLLAEARGLAPRVRSFTIVGSEPERHIPLAAAAGLLRGLVVIPQHGPQLERLVFGSAEEPPERAGHRAGAFEPLRIFEAAHRALRAVEPALLVIDDLQWVDDLSLSLCHYLVRAAVESRQRLAVLAATRPGGPGEELLGILLHADGHRIELDSLDQQDGTALAQALDPTLDGDAALALWRRARGIPFWIEALVLYGHGDHGLQQILTRRLRGAGRDAAAVLGALSVAGRPISAAAAADVIGRELERVEAALDVLAERGLASAREGAWQPVHDLIRATAAAQLPAEARVGIHRRLAAKYERDAGDDLQLLRLALEHRRAAGLSVMALAAKLATSPQRRLLGVDGVRELSAVADGADPIAPATVALHANVASLAYELGAHHEALARWSLVSQRAATRGGRATAALHASRAAYALGKADEARELLTRSRGLLTDDHVLGLEQTVHDAAIALWLEQRTEAGRTLAREAASLAKRLANGRAVSGSGDMRIQTTVLDALRLEYEAAMQEGDPAALLDAAEKREAAASRVGLEEVLEAALALGVALRQNGHVREAVARFRRVWDDAQRAVLPSLVVDAGFWLGRTLEVTRRVGDVPRARHRVARVAATVWLERARVADALALLEQEVAHDANEHQRIVLNGDLAVWASRLRGPDAAPDVRKHLDAANRCAASVGCPRCTGEMLVLRGEALSRIGDHAAARVALDQRNELAFPLDELDRLTYRHAAALAAADRAECATKLDAALLSAASSPYRLTSLWVRLDLGRALADIGDDRAIDELEQVVAAAGRHGAHTVRDIAARSLRVLGVRTWRRGAVGAPLTRREQEVAALVAAGATNREVAETLFVSPKTVERHLANLFRKLEVRNRTELSARLAELSGKRT